MENVGDIDELHYAILRVLDTPLWKSKIHTTLEEQDGLPINNVPSSQTIGRRIDELAAADFLTTTIIADDGVDRDLIIGYMRVNKGDKVIAEKRDEMLQELSHTASNAASEPRRTVSKLALIRMIVEQFELDDDTAERLDSEYDEQTLLSLLALHYAQKNADDLDLTDHHHTYSGNDVKNFKHLIE